MIQTGLLVPSPENQLVDTLCCLVPVLLVGSLKSSLAFHYLLQRMNTGQLEWLLVNLYGWQDFSMNLLFH